MVYLGSLEGLQDEAHGDALKVEEHEYVVAVAVASLRVIDWRLHNIDYRNPPSSAGQMDNRHQIY